MGFFSDLSRGQDLILQQLGNCDPHLCLFVCCLGFSLSCFPLFEDFLSSAVHFFNVVVNKVLFYKIKPRRRVSPLCCSSVSSSKKQTNQKLLCIVYQLVWMDLVLVFGFSTFLWAVTSSFIMLQNCLHEVVSFCLDMLRCIYF